MSTNILHPAIALSSMYKKNGSRRLNDLRLLIRVLIILCMLLSFQTADAGTTISLGNTIGIPHRTVTYEDTAYEIQDIGAYTLGEDINITINTTDINSFQLSLLDKDQNFLWNNMTYYTEGNTYVVMPGSAVTSPGTYVLAVFYQGDVQAVKPVVISSYKMSVNPDTTVVAPGGTLNVKVGVLPDTTQPVKVVLVRNSSSIESTANRTNMGEYEAKVGIPSSAYGEFSLYASIPSGNMILGYPELIGISSGGTINVTEIPTSTASSNPVYSVTLIIIFLFFVGLVIMVIKKRR